MAVAHDNAAESHTGTTGSVSQASFDFSFAPVGTARGLLVFTFVNANANDALSVKIDPTGANIDVPAVTGGRAVDTAGEPGDCKAWFLGSGIPAGTVTIRVNRTNDPFAMYAVAISITADSDTQIVGTPVLLQTDGTLAEQSVDTATDTALRYAGINSGLASVPAAGSNSTSLGVGASIDFGARVIGTVRETTAGSGSRSVGFSSGTSDDRAAVHLAITETVKFLLPTAIDGGELFGTTVIAPGNVDVSPTGIVSEESVNSVLIVQPIVPVGIPTDEAFGNATVAIVLVVTIPSIPSEEVFGALQVSESIAPTSIPSDEEVGTPAIGLILTMSGVASAEGFGTALVSLGGGFSSTDTRRFMAGVDPVPDGTIGAGDRAALSGVYPFVGQIITIPAIETAEIFGVAVLVPGIGPEAIVSSEAFGTSLISVGPISIIVSSIASEEAIGTITTTGITYPLAISSEEAIGTPIVTVLATQIIPSGIVSEELFGTTSVIGVFEIAVTAIDTQEAFGTSVVSLGTLIPEGIATQETFGSPSIVLVPLPIIVPAISSDEMFGSVSVVSVVTPTAIETAELFGTPDVTFQISVSCTGIGTSELFGNATIIPQGITIQCSGIGSDETVSSPTVVSGGIFAEGIGTEEAVGDPVVTGGAILVEKLFFRVTGDIFLELEL